jgi:glycosyltransferase involved in cell wall biosynthesis
VFTQASRSDIPDNVLWLGHLSDDELAALLGECHCLAVPSLVEGFGLPALEAMALGCPIVVSNRSSLPEVCGDAALYASPFEGGQWTSAFQQLRSQPGLRDELIAKGRARSTMFSWQRSAAVYLDLMAALDRAEIGADHRHPNGDAQPSKLSAVRRLPRRLQKSRV